MTPIEKFWAFRNALRRAALAQQVNHASAPVAARLTRPVQTARVVGPARLAPAYRRGRVFR